VHLILCDCFLACSCSGLIMLETYTALKGSEFDLPSFLDVLGEVTGDPAFSMYNLSKKVSPSGDCHSDLEKHESGQHMSNVDVTPMALGVFSKGPVITTKHDNCEETAATVDNCEETAATDERMCETTTQLQNNRTEETNSKPYLNRFLKAQDNNNMINLICDQVNGNEHGKHREQSYSFDKLSKWRDAKRKPGSELFTSAFL